MVKLHVFFGRHSMNGPQKITKLMIWGYIHDLGNLETSISESQKTWENAAMKRDCQAVLAEVHALQQQNEVWDPMNLGSTAVAHHPRSQLFPSIIPFIGEAKNKSLWMRKISLGLLKFGICDDCDGPNPNIKTIDIDFISQILWPLEALAYSPESVPAPRSSRNLWLRATKAWPTRPLAALRGSGRRRGQK